VVIVYKEKTKEIVVSLLKRICSVGDTYECHKENLNYESFLEIQLELVKRIKEAERRISKLGNDKQKNLYKIEEAQERRKLLKLLGTTVAWILLEFDRPYIRSFAVGHDPGFISGKRGFDLEIIALKTAFKFKNSAAILHDITNCLRVGDLSIIRPGRILTWELKLKKRRKRDRREIRQKRKLEILREFYDKGVSTRLTKGMTSVRRLSKRRDKHNWNELSSVIEQASKNKFGIKIVEKCLIYCAVRHDASASDLIDIIASNTKVFESPYMFGCHDNHIDIGLPSIMPFTCFEIPISQKEKLLLRHVNFCVFLDLNSFCEVIKENGLDCTIKKSNKEILVGDVSTEENLLRINLGIINRLLYECLSIETAVSYLKEMLTLSKEGKLSETFT
jgi:hypothetical protein